MKKTLLLMSTLGASILSLAQTKEYKGYNLTLEKNPLTGNMDTSELFLVDVKYEGSINNPNFKFYETTNYTYRNGEFEQRLKSKLFGKNHIMLQQIYADSLVFYYPNKNGNLSWQTGLKELSTFNAENKVISTKQYLDVSYFLEDAIASYLPKSFILNQDKTFHYAGNKLNIFNKRFYFIQTDPSNTGYSLDSTITILSAKGDDSITTVYSQNYLGEYYLYQKTLTNQLSENSTETITYMYMEDEMEINRAKEVTEKINGFLEVTKKYRYDAETENYILFTYDSVYYEADSISSLGKSFILNEEENQFELVAINKTVPGFLYNASNPVPKAPSDLVVVNVLDLERRAESNVGNPGYQLTWKDNSNNEEGFKILRKVIGTNDAPEVIDSVDANITKYVDLNINEGEEYIYFVSAFRQGIASSATVTARTDQTTSSVDLEILNNTDIMPNPIADGAIKVVGLNNVTSYQILNTQGLILQQGEVNNNGTIYENLKSGIYLLKLERNGAVRTIKFEKK